MDRIQTTLKGLVGLLVVMVVTSAVQAIVAGVDQLSLMRGDDAPDIVDVLKAFGAAFVALGGLILVYGRKLGGFVLSKILDVVLGPVDDETEDESDAAGATHNPRSQDAKSDLTDQGAGGPPVEPEATEGAQDAPRPSRKVKPPRGRPRKATRRGRTRGGSNLLTIALMVAIAFLACKAYLPIGKSNGGGGDEVAPQPSPKPIAALVAKIDETLGDSPTRAEDGLFLGAVCRAAGEGMEREDRITTRKQAAEGLVDNLGFFASRRLTRKYPGLSDVVGGHFIDRKFPEEDGDLTPEDRALAVSIWMELGDAFVDAVK